MSGGRFGYRDSTLCDDIFGEYPDYGLDSDSAKKCAKRVRRSNPLGDVEISELTFDVFCLLRSYDWYASGDTGRDDYLKDVDYFKNKWFGKTAKQRVERMTNDAIEEFTQRIKEAMGITDANNQ